MAERKSVADADAWVPNGLRVRGVPQKPKPEPQPLAPAASMPDPLFSPTPDIRPPEPPEPPEPIKPVEAPLPIAQSAWDSEAFSAAKPPTPTAPAKLRPTDGRPGFRPAPILTVLVLCCLAILWMLGSWQYGKYQAKSVPAPVVATPDPAPVSAALEAAEPEYRPVVVEGIVSDQFTRVYAVQDGVRGARLFSHVVLEAGVIFIDRGFVAEQDLPKVRWPNISVRLTGVLRRGAPSNNFTPDNDAAKNVWYWPDLTAMAKARGIEATSVTYYIAENPVDPLGTGSPVENIWARTQGVSTLSAGEHLGYAWQWWGFGIGLIGVYIGLHMRMGRLSFRARA